MVWELAVANFLFVNILATIWIASGPVILTMLIADDPMLFVEIAAIVFSIRITSTSVL